VIRYGEISGAVAGIRLGTLIDEGQVIAHVGKMQIVPQAMLHLEVYDGKAGGALTDRERPPFMRRTDLVDPTELLDAAVILEEAST
jgi:hypothetical protein